MSALLKPVVLTLLAAGFVYTLLTGLFLTLVIKRRDKQPLKYRGPWLVFLSGLGGYLGSVWLIVYLISDQVSDLIPRDIFCQYGEYIVWVHYPLLVMPYVLRCYRLLRIYRADSARHSLSGTQYRIPVIPESYLLKWLAGAVALVVAVKGVLDVAHYRLHVAGYGCSGDVPLLWMSLNLLEIAVSVWVIYRVRAIRDDYGSASELGYVTVIWLISSVAMLALLAVSAGTLPLDWFDANGLTSEVYLDAHAGITVLRNLLILAVSVVWPLYQTYRLPYVPLWSNCDSLRSLDALLKDIVCIQYFRNFLARQPGQVQLVLCWVEVEIYKDLQDPDEMRAQAQRIYERYVSPGGELHVAALSQETVAALEQDVRAGAAAEDSLEQLQQELYEQLNALFPKFLVSDACEQCVHALEREEQLREALERSGML